MSISSEISRISGNVSSALTAISNKGVTVPSGSNSDDLATLIGQISGGGSTTWETLLDKNVYISQSDPNYFTSQNYTTPFHANETYRVTWGNDVYTCQTFATTDPDSIDGYAIGNTVWDGGADTGEPFYITRQWGDLLVGATTDAGGQYEYLKIEKKVSGGGGSTLITKTITANGTYDAEDDDADGYSSVTVNVAGAISIVDTADAAGGTVRTITAVDISSDTVTAGSMLNGVTAHDASGAEITGNIASKSSSDLTASTLTVTAPAGYYAEAATKTLTDNNLSAGNIKKDVQIFGVTGTYEGSAAISNTVTGTFNFDSTKKGTAQEITLNYSGAGYPIAVMIYPAEGGYNSSGTFYSRVQRYAVAFYSASKAILTGTNAVPTYQSSGANNQAVSMTRYKSSSSNAESYTNTGSATQIMFSGGDANASSANSTVRFKSATKMSVFVANNSYGFADGIEYSYCVQYSS